MSDISAIPPAQPVVVAAVSAPPPIAPVAIAVEIVSQNAVPTQATQVTQTAQLVAVEKTLTDAVLLTLQTAQGNQVVVKTDQPTLAHLPLGQNLQIKLPTLSNTQSVLAQILLPATTMVQNQIAAPIVQPTPVAVIVPNLLPNTTLPPLNSLLLVVQTLPQILNQVAVPQLVTPSVGQPAETLMAQSTSQSTGQQNLQNLLQQLQMLPPPKIGAAPVMLPQLLQQGLVSFQQAVQSFQAATLSTPLEVNIQKFLAQQNFGVTPVPQNATVSLPQLQTSPLALLANAPVFNTPQAAALIVNQPLPSLLGGVVQQVLLPGVLNSQALATPFAANVLQQLQPMLMLGRVPAIAAIPLGIVPNTPLALVPQGIVALPTTMAVPTLPGTLLLLQAPPAALKDFYLSLAPQITTGTPAIPTPQTTTSLPSFLPMMAAGLTASAEFIDMPFALGPAWDAGNALWQGLEKLGLLQSLPNFATPSLAQVPSLPLALMQIFGAFKKQDASAWIGAEAVAVLAKTAEGRKLLASFGEAAKAHQQTTQEVWRDGWQPLPLPLMHDNKWQILPLFYRHQENPQTADQDDNDAQDKRHGGRATRFLVQMPQTAWGHMQLDGFLQLAAKVQTTTQLDMVLRTEHALADSLKQGLINRYASVLGALGYAGQIVCQTTAIQNHVLLQPVANGFDAQG